MRKLEVVDTITVCSCYVPSLFYGDLSEFENSEEFDGILEMIEQIGPRMIEVVEGSEDFSRCDISELYGDTVKLNVYDWVTK